MTADDTRSPAPGRDVPAISVVSTMYRSRQFLETFLAESLAALQRVGCPNYEIVLVNDGSPDDSLAYALSRAGDVPGLVVVDLSRNFGHHAAAQAGLRAARGELVFLIDCDLEVRPASLVDFHQKIVDSRADLVFGYQEARKGGWLEKFGGGFFWKIFNTLSDIEIPHSIVTERIMTRRFIDAFLKLGDHNLFLAGMMSWTGFTQIGMPVSKKQREGRSTYTLVKRMQLVVNAVSSFSSKPLVWLFNAGLGITFLSFGYAAYLVLRKIFFNDALLGFTAIMAMLAMSLGVMTTALGLVGIYLGKVFNQVQNRPTYIVKDVHRRTAIEMNTSAIRNGETS